VIGDGIASDGAMADAAGVPFVLVTHDTESEDDLATFVDHLLGPPVS
jgi:hypothetical protein